MNKEKYFFILYFIVFFTFNSCKDPLGEDDIVKIEKIDAPNILPERIFAYNSIEILWTEYQAKDFDRYEVYFYYHGSVNSTLYLIIKDSKICYCPINGTNWAYGYFIRVINKNGIYADSKVTYFVPISTVPSPIEYFDYKVISGKTDSLYWSKYKDIKNVPFSFYELRYSNYPDYPDGRTFILDSIKMIDYNYRYIDTLRFDHNISYYFKVRTFNILGNFAESKSLEVKLP